MTASVEAIQFVIALIIISGILLQDGVVMFNTFTSSVEPLGNQFGNKGVSRPFDIKVFMSYGFNRRNTLCHCFEDDGWKSFHSWEIYYD